MIFIYLGGGRSQLWLTLLGLFVTVVFNSGLLSSPVSYPARPNRVCGTALATLANLSCTATKRQSSVCIRLTGQDPVTHGNQG